MNRSSLFRYVGIFITLCLCAIVYWSHQQSATAAAELEETHADHQNAKAEDDDWVALEERFKNLQEQFREQTNDTADAFHSLRIAELRDARSKVMAEVELDKAMISASMPGSIWVPQPGHHVEFLIQAENLEKEDVVAGEFNLPKRLRFELKPRQLHSFNFQLEDKSDEKSSLLRFEFEGETHIEMVLQGRFNTKSSPGNNHFKLIRPRLVDAYGIDFKQKRGNDQLRRGAWCSLQATTYSSRSKLGKPITITCQPVIFHPDTYIRNSWSLLLGRAKIPFTEVTESESPWHGFLKIEQVPAEPHSPRVP